VVHRHTAFVLPSPTAATCHVSMVYSLIIVVLE